MLTGRRQASQSTRQASCRIVPKDIQEYHFANWQRWLPLARATISSRSSKRRAMMTFRPLHDRVLVRRIEAAEKTAGGIIIPDTAQEKPQEGEVISTGNGSRAEDGRTDAHTYELKSLMRISYAVFCLQKK